MTNICRRRTFSCAKMAEWAAALQAAILLGVSGCANRGIQIVPTDNLFDTDGSRLEEQQDVVFELGHGRDVKGTMTLTTKGNGTLHVLNIDPKIIDMHADGSTYSDKALKVILVDVDGDGYRDLVMFGRQIKTSDEGETSYRDVAGVFIYRPQTNTFVEFSGSPWSD